MSSVKQTICTLIFVFCVTTNGNDVLIENLTAATYTGLEFDGNYASLQSGSITTFKDLTQIDKYYYFVSDFHTLHVHRNLSISSNIYDQELQQFNSEDNSISNQLPYEIEIDPYYLGLVQESSCTNPITYDILICYTICDEIYWNIHCKKLLNDPISPKWSQPVQITNATFKSIQMSLECFDDGYVIFFGETEYYGKGKPLNIYYSTLDIHGNLVINTELVLPGFNSTYTEYAFMSTASGSKVRQQFLCPSFCRCCCGW